MATARHLLPPGGEGGLLKYIMIRVDEEGGAPREWPIIFPDELVHAYMFEAVRGMKVMLGHNRWARPYLGAKAVSAGEITVAGHCHGGSETLQLKSRGNIDTNIVNAFDYLKGLL